MAITPDEIARRFAPPRTEGEHYARKLAVTDAAMTLADLILQMVPGSREQSIAVEALESAVQWAHCGIDRRLIDAAAPVPYAVAEPVDGLVASEWGRAMWELGIINSRLFPDYRLVALVLATYAGPDGQIPADGQPTLNDLRYGAGMHIQQLHLALRQLERESWIERDVHMAGSTRRTTYRLTLPAAKPDPARSEPS